MICSLRRRRPSGRYFSPAKSTQKPPGTQGRRALLGPNAPVSPDPFRRHYGTPAGAQRSGSCGERMSSGVNEACRKRQAERYAACEDDAAVQFNDPPNLKAVACRFGALRAVPASPEQRYPPRLVSRCNSSAISMPHKVFAPCSGLRSSGSAAQKPFSQSKGGCSSGPRPSRSRKKRCKFPSFVIYCYISYYLYFPE